jgi:NADPH2:quinone reductase
VKAVVLHEVGGPLALEDWDEPSGTVLDVRAAGVNFADILIRRGMYPQMPVLPHVLGNEVAGDLDGRRVMAYPRAAGGYAERVEIDPAWVCELPEGASYAAGAAFMTAYLTAHVPLTRQLHVGNGTDVLVHAGAGGVGAAAIQLAKLRGARVIATASSAEKRAFALQMGADEARGYDELDDVQVDVVLDTVGGELFTRSLTLLRPLGAIVAIGFAGGLWQDPAVQWLVGRNVSVVGVYLGRLMRLRPDLVHAALDELLELWRRGDIDPPVGATFPLADAGDAHALIETRRHVGKVILEP